MKDVMYLLQSRPGYIPPQGKWVTSTRAYHSLTEAKEDAILCGKKSNTEYRVARFGFEGTDEDCSNCSGTGNIHTE